MDGSRLLRESLAGFFTLSLALLLLGCTLSPITDSTALSSTSPATTPQQVAPPVNGANSALVGVYQSDVITRAGFGPWTEVMTLTMSLFADGAFEQLFDSAADWGTQIEPRGETAATGTWTDQGDFGVLHYDRGGEARFSTIGADALVVSLPTTWFGVTTSAWVLTKVSPTAAPLYACLVKQVLSARLNDPAHRPDPALAGVYAAQTQFAPEFGNVSPVLTLFENGWAEFVANLEGAPDAYPVEWGIWWVSEDAEPAVTLLLKDPQTGIIASAERTYLWDGATLHYRGDQAGAVFSFSLTATDRLPEVKMAALHDIVFADLGVQNGSSACAP